MCCELDLDFDIAILVQFFGFGEAGSSGAGELIFLFWKITFVPVE